MASELTVLEHAQATVIELAIKFGPKVVVAGLILVASFLREHQIEFTEGDIQNNVDFIKRRIRQEVFTSLFGLQEGFRIAVQGDNQVVKALEVMPQAKQLMTSGRTTAATPAAENSVR